VAPGFPSLPAGGCESAHGAAGFLAPCRPGEAEDDEGREEGEEEEGPGASKALCLLVCTCVLVSPGVALRALGAHQAGPPGGPPAGLLLWLQTLARAVGVPASTEKPQGGAGGPEREASASEAFLQSEYKLTGEGGAG